MSRTALLESAIGTALEAGPVAGRPLRAVIYARVSSDPKEQLRSVSQQIDECTAECQRRGWDIVKVFKDNDRSASRYATKDRPKYRELLEYLHTGHCDVLLTWESSRAQRDLEAYVNLRKVAEGNGVLWCYKGRLYDLSRTDDRFTTGLDALLDERESSVIRDRIMRDVRQNAAKGRPHGQVPYGYRRHYDPSTKTLVAQEIREDQAAIVREAARRIAAGEGVLTVAKDLEARGVPSPSGGARWYTSTIKRMVTNPVYIGKRVHQGKVVRDAVWPPLLDEETFYTCTRWLSDPARRTQRDTKVRHLLSSLAVCGVCDAGLSAQRVNWGRWVYQCKRGAHTAVTLEQLDEYITGVVVGMLARPDAIDLLGGSDRADEARAAAAEAAEKRARLDEFYDSAAAGKLSAPALERIEARLLPEIEAAEKRADAVRLAPLLRDLIRPDAAQVWEDLTTPQKREVIRTLMGIRLLRAPYKGRAPWVPEQRVAIEWKHDHGAAE